MHRYLVLMISLFGLSGCAVSTPDSDVQPLVQISDMQTGAYATLPSLADVNGQLAVLYATKEDRVVLQVGKQPKQLIDTTARVNKGGSFFKLWPADKTLHAAWWSHQQGKNVYITSSPDGGKTFAPVSMVNDVNDVLPPFTLTHGPQGILGMTYQDERAPRFQVYFNRSVDNGANWPRPDTRLDSPPAEGRSSNVHEPQTVEAGASWVSVWTDNIQNTKGGQDYRIVSRRTDDAGLTWSAPKPLVVSDHHISTLVLRASGPNLVVVADELNKGLFALTSQDAGNTWQPAGSLAETSGVSNSGVAIALSNGRAHIAWMAQRSEEKLRIMTASLDITKHEWLGSARRLDTKPSENTTSSSPAILATGQGALVSAWVDYRDIRPNIYLATSYDQGVSWSAPQALLKPGAVSAGWPQLVQVKDQAVIAYELYPTERVADGSFNTQVLPVDSGATAMAAISAFPTFTEAERAAKLAKRANALWSYRVAGNYEQAYDMFDFAYRAATPKKMYLNNIGVITYLTYSVDETNIVGNVADVKMKLRYEVKPTMLPSTGKPITVPPVDVDTPTKWVWVENDWYMVYTPSFDPPVLKY